MQSCQFTFIMRKARKSAQTPSNLGTSDTLKPRRVGRGVRAAALATSVVVGAPSAYGMATEGNPSPIKPVTAVIARLAGQVCRPLAPEIHNNALALMRSRASNTPLVARLSNHSESLEQIRHTTPEEDNEYFEARQRIAKANGFTLVDFRPYKKDLLQAANTDQALDAIGKYLANYYIEVGITQDFKGTPLDPDAQTDLNTLQLAGATMMRTYSSNPTSVVQLPGYERLNLVNAPLTSHAGQHDAAKRTMYMSLPYTAFDDTAAAELVGHELGHGVNEAACGTSDIRIDNGLNFNTTWIPYGASHITEHGATLFGEMFANGLPSTTSSSLQEDFAHEAGLLEQKLPGTLNYYYEVGKLSQNQTSANQY